MHIDYKNPENKLSSFGYRIWLDRYAQKDIKREHEFAVGDFVIYRPSNSSQIELAEISNIYGKNADIITIKEDSGFGCETISNILLSELEYPLETNPEQMMDRMAKANAINETEGFSYWESQFRHLLDGYKFIPGGRICTALGTNQNLTHFNCFVINSPEDSREGIFKTGLEKVQIMSRGGGVGFNLSTLRPKNAYVAGVNGKSSGPVSWAELYSTTTNLVEQGGKRRGALMLILNCWHPDIEEFILAKRDMKKINYANISVGLSDPFMKAVENDEDWDLMFPDTSEEEYKNWNGVLEKYEGKVIVHKTVKAKYIWDLIVESAWMCAEPGLWFYDRANYFSNSFYYPEGYLVGCNPCGEENLPPNAVCNLGHINVSKFYDYNSDYHTLDWKALGNCVELAVRFLDNVIDITPYFSEAIENQQKKERRIGLGTLGLAELLIKMELIYGSKESLNFIDRLYSYIKDTAYMYSIELAKEKGVFPYYAKEFVDSGFCKESLDPYTRLNILKFGIRNVNLLTQAPTGSVGSMVGTSSGIEPFYAWEYWRTSRLGRYKENVKIYNAYRDLPNADNFLVTAKNLSPEEHVAVQAAIQKHVDNAISKTCNLPEHYAKEQVSEIYWLMYKSGCKGGTVYRDNSRNYQVLSTKEDTANFMDKELGVQSTPKIDKVITKTFDEVIYDKTKEIEDSGHALWGYRFPENVREGKTVSLETGAGTVHVTMNEIGGKPWEVFINLGKGGSDINAMSEALGRLISLSLQIPSDLSQYEKVSKVIEQLEGIGGATSWGFGKEKIISLPDATAKALSLNWENIENDSVILSSIANINKNDNKNWHGSADLCPTCGNLSLIRKDGCKCCDSCGYSEC